MLGERSVGPFGAYGPQCRPAAPRPIAPTSLPYLDLTMVSARGQRNSRYDRDTTVATATTHHQLTTPTTSNSLHAARVPSTTSSKTLSHQRSLAITPSIAVLWPLSRCVYSTTCLGRPQRSTLLTADAHLSQARMGGSARVGGCAGAAVSFRIAAAFGGEGWI